MKVLVLINNNLKFDTRVKRHIKSISDVVDNVHVIARPIPDRSYGMEEIRNVSWSFFDYLPQEHPINHYLLDYAEKWSLKDIFLRCLPVLEQECYYYEPILECYTKALEIITSGERWRDITNRIPEEMGISNALSFPLTLLESSVQLAKLAENESADVVLCNDIDTLLAGVIHKKKYNSRLVYDYHDIAADITEGVFPQMYSNMLAVYEKELIQHADVVMSIVSQSLAWSKKHYNYDAPAIAMLNCSKFDNNISKKDFLSDKIRIYYHGMSDKSRGLKEIIDAVSKHDSFELILRCLPSDNLNYLKKYVEDNNLGKKVHFLEPVQPEMIPLVANRDGDIGYHMCDTKNCLNWRFALTNKFIEYTRAGLPVIVSDGSPEADIVKKYNNGWILTNNTQNEIEDVLNKIIKDYKKLNKKSEKSFKVADSLFSWDKYEKILQGIILGNDKVVRQSQIKVKEKKSRKYNKQDENNYTMAHTYIDDFLSI